MPSSHLAVFIDEFTSVGEVEIDPGKVLAALCGLPDPRKRRGVRHRFPHLLVIMVCSVLAGAKSLVEMAEWAADTARDQLATLGIGSPHATTLARVLQLLDADALDQLIGAWDRCRPSPLMEKKSVAPRTAAVPGSTYSPGSTTPLGPSSCSKTCPRSTMRSPTSSRCWRESKTLPAS